MYTRCMDSVLCVPLMIDAAVWCDHFARLGAATEDAARATAYLFKVPEGGARGGRSWLRPSDASAGGDPGQAGRRWWRWWWWWWRRWRSQNPGLRAGAGSEGGHHRGRPGGAAPSGGGGLLRLAAGRRRGRAGGEHRPSAHIPWIRANGAMPGPPAPTTPPRAGMEDMI